MAKRVLGNDPFASGEDGGKNGEEKPVEAGAGAGAGEKSGAKARGTRRPPAATSKAPKARVSKRPPAKSPAGASETPEGGHEGEGAEAGPVEVKVPPAPRLPAVAPASDGEARYGAGAGVGGEDIIEVEAEPVERAVPDGRPLEEQIREVEAQLDKLLDSAGSRAGDKRTLAGVAERLRAKIEPHGGAGAHGAGADDANVFDVARELLSSEYYLRQWGRVAMRDRTEEVDDFGLDPKFEARIRPLVDFLYERWWRVEAYDIERVPAEGRVILCANHSGALPYDGAMLAAALRREHPARRELRWLAEDFVFHMPFLGVLMNRIGAVRACQENAERLLRKDNCVGVFPEGVKGIAKLYRDRYKLQRFGRGGHVKLAIRTRTPIVPVAILGAEEAHPLIAPSRPLAKLLGVPYVPVTPTFPWLGPAGLVPLPSKWKIFFLDPIPMDGYPVDAADDDVLVGRLNEKIRGLIQEELDRALRERKSVWSG